GGIDAAVGAYKPVMGFDDENPAIHSDDPPGFPENHLHHSGIFVVFFGPLQRRGGRSHGIEPHDSSFRLADDFLRDDEERAGFHAILAERRDDKLAKIVAGLDLGHPLEPPDPYPPSGHAEPAFSQFLA